MRDIRYWILHTVSTLFATINNPEDISIGDIFRYFKHAFGAKMARGLTQDSGGFVEGGIMAWSEAVAEKFESLGGDLRLNAKVREVLVENGTVTGVVVEGIADSALTFTAPRVASNIPAQSTFRIIPERHFPKEWTQKTQRMYGYGSYTPYMGLNRLAMPEEEACLGLKNTCVLPQSDGFAYDVYICWNIQSAIDLSAAPAGKHLYAAYLPMTEQESRNKTLVNKLVDRLPRFMEEVYPGFEESVDWQLDLVCWRLEGVAKSISQAGTQKVPVKSEYVKGLYFAGDTAKGYGVAMDCAIISGMICASAITGKDYGVS
jgi:phytoene dehydrogenase-like protein